ncbi:50S ribosomal protein L2 [Candidatus Saccharibacteria bacterium]|nr:50S ribosomal protein L2 [Candidatus Saccharibacteria bacterium]MBI2285286.1 50S ribosomal protein L2 [Candidatus Saccharibacteria bacterium]
MAIRSHNPTTAARRGMTSQDFAEITAKKPLKSLLKVKRSRVGRSATGRITTRHRGGGVRRFYRVVDFKLAPEAEFKVEAIEYDPNRSARIALIKDQNGKYRYILATKGMKPGDKLAVQEEAVIEAGNRLPLKNIPIGTAVHAVELQPGRGAQLARSAGSSAQLVAKDEKYAQIRLPSGEVRMININSLASIGAVGNEQHQNVKLGKAGRRRRMGIRPTVRGVAMNAASHPHGGGEGKGKGGSDPRTPWGQRTLGYKTRSRKTTDKFIVRKRRQGKRR